MYRNDYEALLKREQALKAELDAADRKAQALESSLEELCSNASAEVQQKLQDEMDLANKRAQAAEEELKKVRFNTNVKVAQSNSTNFMAVVGVIDSDPHMNKWIQLVKPLFNIKVSY